MKTDEGQYIAQVKKDFWSDWDDIFNAGILGLVEYSEYKRESGRHNNRWSDRIEECEEIIKEHSRRIEVESGKNLTLVKSYELH